MADPIGESANAEDENEREIARILQEEANAMESENVAR